MEKVAVNTKQCENIAQMIKRLRFRSDFLEEEIFTFSEDKEIKAKVYFYATAICHQTRKLKSEKRKLVGWDYLTKIFIELSKNEPSFLEAKNLKVMDENKLAIKLKTLFSDNNDVEHTALDRVSERAKFLIDCAKKLDEKYSGKVLNLLEKSNSFLVKNNHGLYKLLEEFKAYSDPLKKKSGVLLKFLIQAGILKINDPENFVPIVDYHMLRVLLRMGCIEVKDDNLRRKLYNFDKIKSDEEFRKTSQKAFRKIAKLSKKEIFELDPIFWSLGRSCCQIKTTLCFDGKCDKNPCTFYTYMDLNNHDRCFFESVCKGSVNERYRNLKEPNIETHFY